jgi:hypothetical protein
MAVRNRRSERRFSGLLARMQQQESSLPQGAPGLV